MKLKGLILILFILCFLFPCRGQDRFEILDKRKDSETVPFSLINNMIVLSADLNGKKLSFLLDTGIKTTMIFNLKIEDSLKLKNVKQMKLRGLGEGGDISALRSHGNYFDLKGIVNPSLSLYIITDDLIDLSAKMGMDIHGIIGGGLFRDFVVKINYASQKLTFYKHGTYDPSKCKDCETFPLDFYNNKPFVNAIVENKFGKEVKVKLLIDSGGGDSLWLFPHSNPDIVIEDRYFEDFLGKGLNGNIMGKRSRISKFKIGSFEFDNPTVSYPDSTSILRVHANKDRNGTLGAGILKRFHVVMDYRNSQISLKKNKKLYNQPFLYNKSGMELIYGGEMLVKENRVRFTNTRRGDSPSITDIFYSYGLTYKPSYRVSKIRTGSPAHYAGIREGDILLELNGKPAYDLKIEEIIYFLSQKDDKRIKVLVDRNGEHLRYEFYLKSLL